MASPWSLVCLLVFVLLCGGSRAASQRYLSVSLDELISSKAQLDCPPVASPAATIGNKLPIRRNCVCPPYCGGAEQRRRNVLVHDRDRLTTLLRSHSASVVAVAPPAAHAIPTSQAQAPSVSIPDRPGAYVDTQEFVIVVGFGTPAQPSTVIFDTGSDLSWIQCLPCSGHCHPQHDPLFNPLKSTSYAAVPCGSARCTLAGGKCNGTTCLYSIEYGDGSWSTSGILAQETLTLSSSSKLSNFPFGCGQRNLGEFGDVDGLLGFGRGPFSLPSQTASSFGGTFSYCLPSQNNTPGYLNIGSTPVSAGKVQYTAMIQKSDYPSLYFVDLVSIDIGGYILPVPPTVFTSNGTNLDSGAILTYLPGEAYTLLRDRFKFTMQGNKPAPAYDILDTCYDFAGQSAIVIPAVSLKFGDSAVFDLDFDGIMIFPDPSQPAIGCLAFTARPAGMPFSIIGNTQQRRAEVIYDVAAEKIGFVPTSC